MPRWLILKHNQLDYNYISLIGKRAKKLSIMLSAAADSRAAAATKLVAASNLTVFLAYSD